MNFFIKNQVITWILAGLLVVSLSILGTLIYSRFRQPVPGTDESGCGARCALLSSELGLSAAQAERIDRIREGHRSTAMTIADSLKSTRSDLVTELGRDIPDTLRLRQLAQRIGMFQARLTDLTVDQYLMIRQECTPEQQEKLSSLYYEIMGCCPAGEGRHFRARCGRN